MPHVSVYIRRKIYDKLQEVVKKEKISLNEAINRLLEKALELSQ